MSTADKIAAVSLCYALGSVAVLVGWKNPDWAYRPSSHQVQLFGRNLVRLFHFMLGLTLLILSTFFLFA
ncbi:MAG: hypothetical protein K9N47_05375 [Prosthecobacter sp.]|nr:hypothetical protein [Prosthecobacter sp.]